MNDELATLTPEIIRTLEKQQNEGVNASILLENQIFKKAISQIKQDASYASMGSIPGSGEAKHFHYLHIAICELEKEISSYVDVGKNATSALKERQEMMEQKQNQIPARVWIDPPESKK